MTMIAPFKFYNFFFTCKTSGESYGTHGGLRAGVDKSDLVNGRVKITNEGGELIFSQSRGTKASPFFKSLN